MLSGLQEAGDQCRAGGRQQRAQIADRSEEARREIEDFLAASTGTPVEESRPTMHLPAIPDGGIEQGGDELAASLAEAGQVAEGPSAQEGKIPSDVTEAELSDAASKAAGEGSESGNGD